MANAQETLFKGSCSRQICDANNPQAQVTEVERLEHPGFAHVFCLASVMPCRPDVMQVLIETGHANLHCASPSASVTTRTAQVTPPGGTQYIQQAMFAGR